MSHHSLFPLSLYFDVLEVVTRCKRAAAHAGVVVEHNSHQDDQDDVEQLRRLDALSKLSKPTLSALSECASVVCLMRLS